MNRDSKILVVGDGGIIENSLYFYLKNQGYQNVFSSTQAQLDVLNQGAVKDFFNSQKPEYVFLSSTRSGGIAANQEHGAEFLYHNVQSQINVIQSACELRTKKLLYYASSCVYPRDCQQPIKEEYVLTGPLEPTSEAYAIAKIAGIRLCQLFRKQYKFNAIVCVPATIFGPGSEVDLQTAHVMGALIGKFYQAVADKKNEVTVWGSGTPRREFLYVDDLIDASLFLMEHYEDSQMINIGTGVDVTIKELAQLIAKASGFQGKINFDTTKPDGVARKLLDHSCISNLGWKARTDLQEGISKTYQWYEQTQTAGINS